MLSRYNKTRCVPKKVGLYTSPHSVAVGERSRINSEPISETLFAKYFFEVWNALDAEPGRKPVYFRMLTLLSFHVFIGENVDVAIYKVGWWGDWDSTNIAEAPAVTGITTLCLDHFKSLGATIELTVWQKAGISKQGCPAFIVGCRGRAQKASERERCRTPANHLTVHPALRDVKISLNEDH